MHSSNKHSQWVWRMGLNNQVSNAAGSSKYVIMLVLLYSFICVASVLPPLWCSKQTHLKLFLFSLRLIGFLAKNKPMYSTISAIQYWEYTLTHILVQTATHMLSIMYISSQWSIQKSKIISPRSFNGRSLTGNRENLFSTRKKISTQKKKIPENY